jgi:16S rRNA processing protein RimM
MVLLKLKGIDTVEQAQSLRDQVLYLCRDDPHIPAGTVFQADLIGLPVLADGEEIGKITEILTMPSSDVWVVKGEHEYMIPHVKAFVPELDLSLGYVAVNLIEGMKTDAD